MTDEPTTEPEVENVHRDERSPEEQVTREGLDPDDADPSTAIEGSEPSLANEGSDADTFPRAYVEKLRDENAKYRTRAQTADEAAQRLLAATIASTTTGILADPTDLPEGDYLDADGWPDPELIRTAADELVAVKPHLGDRRPRGSIGQGAASEAGSVDLAGILRSRA